MSYMYVIKIVDVTLSNLNSKSPNISASLVKQKRKTGAETETERHCWVMGTVHIYVFTPIKQSEYL